MLIRRPKVEFFVGSTVDEVQQKFNEKFSDICPGNILKTKLYKFEDGTYCYELIFAEVRERIETPL